MGSPASTLCVGEQCLWVGETCVCGAARRAPHSLLKGRLWQSPQVQWLQGDSEALLYGLITLKRAVHVYGDAESRFAMCEVSVYAELFYMKILGV